MTDIKELIAAAVHEQWSMWQRHQSKLLGNLELSGDMWLEWDRKAKAKFEELTPQEQKSDIEIAEKIWLPLIYQWLESKRLMPLSRTPDMIDIEALQKELAINCVDSIKGEKHE